MSVYRNIPALEVFRQAWLGGGKLPIKLEPGWRVSSISKGEGHVSITLLVKGPGDSVFRVTVSPLEKTTQRYGNTSFLALIFQPSPSSVPPTDLNRLLDSVRNLLEKNESRLSKKDVRAVFSRLGEEAGSRRPRRKKGPNVATPFLEPGVGMGAGGRPVTGSGVVVVEESRGVAECTNSKRSGSLQEVLRFFHVDYDYGGEGRPSTSRIGILYRCNQSCSFCNLSHMNVEVPPGRVRRAMRESRARGSRNLVIAGGEPTLSPLLPEYIRYARRLGFDNVKLQTNAVRLDDRAYAAMLRTAGLTSAQVSLHGMDGAVSDNLTGAPGTHARTLRGVDNLLELGVFVILNHLIFKDNCRRLVGFVREVGRRWGGSIDLVRIQFHTPKVEFSTREMALLHIARYSSYARVLRRAFWRARELGISVQDMQDPTGIPSLCVFGVDEFVTGPIQDQSKKPRFHAAEAGWLTRVRACSVCNLATYCMGVPRDYLDLYGDGEFKPELRHRRGALR